MIPAESRTVVPGPGAARFAVAVRVSRVMGRSGERFHSPETQIAGARRAVAAVGGVVDEAVGDRGVFYDLDVSGAVTPSDRPGLGAALDLVRAGRLSGIAVYDLSRWSRDTVSGLRELEEVAAVGGQVVSAAETIDLETPGGVFATTIQLAAAKLRRDEAARAWRSTHQSRFDRGLPHGRIPMGYISDGEGGAAVDPMLGPVIAESLARYAAGTLTQVAIAARLTELRGRLTRQGVVSQLLRNPFYVGQVDYNGQSKTGRHTPLVDEETWERVQQRLRDDYRYGPWGRAPMTGLTGLLFCEACKKPLYRRGRGAETAGGDWIKRLICSGKRDGCVGVGAPHLADLEEAVLAKLAEVAAGLADRAPEFLARSAQSTRARADLTKLRAELKAAKAALGQAGALLARGVLDDLAYAATADELTADVRRLEAQLTELEGRSVEAPTAAQLESAAARLLELWDDGMTPVEQRAALRMFFTSVYLRPAAYRGEQVKDRLRFVEPD